MQHWVYIFPKDKKRPQLQLEKLGLAAPTGDVTTWIYYEDALKKAVRELFKNGEKVVLFSDRSDDAYQLAAQYTVYGTLYDTGVLVAGKDNPDRGEPTIVEVGLPLGTFEAVAVLAKDGHTLTPEWEDTFAGYWSSLRDALALIYNKKGAPHDPVSWTDVENRWELVFVVPTEDPDAFDNVQAAVSAFELTRVAILGDPGPEVRARLDRRYTCILKPAEV